MRRLKLIMTLALSVTAIAIAVATYNLYALYYQEKEQMLATVRKCAENAIILEMIGRMQRSEVDESFIRLNTFIETVQQKDGISANSDTLEISLASILSLGLEFQDARNTPDTVALDSIFLSEIHRSGLNADRAFLRKAGSAFSADNYLWKTYYKISPSSHREYEAYVSPMYREVLAHLWGIVIPFAVLILVFCFLSIYLTGIIRKLRTLEQMKDDFTHNMTHELKTPVAVAYSAADSMLRYYDQSDEARNKQFLKIIMQRLSYLSGMIENILSMSMERFKSMKLDLVRFELKPVVTEVADMIKLKAGKPVKIDVDIPDGLAITADSLHFGNVLSNLLDNAVKYSGDSVEISIKADCNSITVADNGIGIKRENLPFIFDKFYRVPSGDRYETSGYGLGLFYVKQIIELLGWEIEVTSKPGTGTHFRIRMRNEDEER
ncbi:MAG: HAMP domain-containing histidine kinase [Muribaculaceae bacterium]|nr:HAMP domain-containing histidine kinase [Muribaculaceae bacterium]